MGRALKAELAREPGPTIFLRSPLGRVRETSEIVGRELGLDPVAMARRSAAGRTRLRRVGRLHLEGDRGHASDGAGRLARRPARLQPARRRDAFRIAPALGRGAGRHRGVGRRARWWWATASAARWCAASISASMRGPCSCWKSRRTPSSACSPAARNGSRRCSTRPQPRASRAVRRQPPFSVTTRPPPSLRAVSCTAAMLGALHRRDAIRRLKAPPLLARPWICHRPGRGRRRRRLVRVGHRAARGGVVGRAVDEARSRW